MRTGDFFGAFVGLRCHPSPFSQIPADWQQVGIK
jgi:hypothetical protein